MEIKIIDLEFNGKGIKESIYTGIVKIEKVKPNKPYIRLTFEDGHTTIIDTRKFRIEFR